MILDNHEDVSFDTLLVATGRQPNIKVAEDLDIDMDGKFVQVDEHYQTTINHVYAIGDLVRVINLHIQRVHMDYMLLKLWLD